MLCFLCKEEIQDGAIKCRHCGSMLNEDGTAAIVANSESSIEYTDYSQVPWYRKRWFGVMCVLFFPPGLLYTLITGNLYYQKKDGIKPLRKIDRIAMIVVALISSVWIVGKLME